MPVHAQTPEIEALGAEVPELFKAGHYDEATLLAQRRAELVGERIGKTTSDYATMLSDLGTLLSLQGRHAEAEPIIEQVLDIRQKLFGGEHPDVAASMNNFAEFYRAQGRAAGLLVVYQGEL